MLMLLGLGSKPIIRRDAIETATRKWSLGNTANEIICAFISGAQADVQFSNRCHVVGKSQMLSIGGLDATYENDALKLIDPTPQGLEIFDLTNMTWSNQYDANAAPYKSPQVVKDYYATR